MATPPPSSGGAFRTPGQLVRSRTSRVIAGVCGGFAEHYGWDLNLVRIITAVITFFTVMPLFAYLAAWIIIPDGQYVLPAPPPPPQAASTSESPVT
ncbi:PspC domain-containing protein [Granulicella arctica]|uniref:Phage shock protein C n=1 Tax=Granulicella arctica TaxID=940613 RepID=A0A7Y9TGP8_9BACT|nr:phage shock protein C [Granulicella arctica]